MDMAIESSELLDKAQKAEGCEREKEEGIPLPILYLPVLLCRLN